MALKKELYAPDLDEIRDHLEHAVDSGLELPADTQLVATMISGMMLQFAMMWLVGPSMGRKLDDEEAVDALTRFILYGLHGAGRAR